jgi:esterase/lipase
MIQKIISDLIKKDQIKRQGQAAGRRASKDELSTTTNHKKSGLIYMYKIILFVIFIISSIFLSGVLLDKNAALRVQKMYVRDSSGVIDGLQAIKLLQGKKRAILFVHGFSDSPALFSDLVHDLKNKVDSDIYVPLLPFHGRDLQSFAQLNNKIILNDLELQINALAKKYQSLTVVGMSYGGALLTSLVNAKRIPDSVNLILYAPAFYLNGNTLLGRTEIHIYGWWRKYCNYSILGCKFPSYVSGDEASKSMFDKEKSLQYVVMPAVLQLYQFDLENRQGLRNIHRPYNLIMAVDDNRVSYIKTKAACQSNPYCHFYSFPSGKHIIHWGSNKKRFEDLLIKLISK